MNLREKNLEGAVNEFQKALSLKPHDPYILRDLGQTYLQKRDLNSAIQYLSQASLLNPWIPMPPFIWGGLTWKRATTFWPWKTFSGP